MEASFGILTVLAAGTVFLLVLVPQAQRGARAALATLPAGLGFLALVALARWNYPYEELFDADRYFFPLTMAAALGGAALVASLRTRLAGDPVRRRVLAALALAAFGFSVFLHRTALLNRVSWGVYAAHAARLAQLTTLAGLLSDAARALPAGSAPLAVPDANLRVPGIHNGWISTRFLLAIANRRPTPRLVLADGPVGGRDAAVLNDAFERWRIAIGEPEPWFAVEDGALRDLRQRDAVDFLFSSRDADVSGFWGWERPRRWMGRRATVRIVVSTPDLRVDASCPVTLLAAARPPVPPPSLEVSVEDEAGGPPVPLGRIAAVERDRHIYTFRVPDAVFAGLRGRTARVILAASPTWRPADVTPGSDDTRELSVEVFRVSFAKE
jgi:hypothetical protein